MKISATEFLKMEKADKQALVNKSTIRKRTEGDRVKYSITQTSCCQESVEWEWGEAPEVCPYCGDKYWRLPKLEYYLFDAQERFLKEYPSTKVLGTEMFPLLLDYAKNQIQSLLKGRAIMTNDTLDEKAYEAAVCMVEVILKSPEHRMQYSFGAYLLRLCKSVVYREQNTDKTISLNEVLDNEDYELLDLIDRKLAKGEFVEDSLINSLKSDSTYKEVMALDEATIDKVMELILQSVDAIVHNMHGQREALLYLLGLNLLFSHKDMRPVLDFYEVAGGQVKKFVEKGEILVFDYLRNIIRGRKAI